MPTAHTWLHTVQQQRVAGGGEALQGDVRDLYARDAKGVDERTESSDYMSPGTLDHTPEVHLELRQAQHAGEDEEGGSYQQTQRPQSAQHHRT